jgi:SAM-dependent methyltransferase
MDSGPNNPSSEDAAPDFRAAARRRLRRRIAGAGVLVLPALPELIDENCEKLLAIFRVLERPFNDADTQSLRNLLATVTAGAWAESPSARIRVEYQVAPNPDGGVNYEIAPMTSSLGQDYDSWVGSRPQPFFGAHPNARVLALANSLGTPGTVRILDIGAGDGRNAIPLARAGFLVDCVEISEAFAGLLRTGLGYPGQRHRVFIGDVLDPALKLPANYYKLVVIAGVLVAHVRDVAHLRSVLTLVARVLVEGGHVVFSIFRTTNGFEPDPLTRELGQAFWTVPFTPEEIETATRDLGLELVDDVSYVDYEREHLPESWPPTGYFENYASGVDLFDLPKDQTPLDMRWLTYRKV